MEAIVAQSFCLAVTSDSSASDMVELFAARFNCAVQSVHDRMLALEIARRTRPRLVIADGDLLKNHQHDFIARIRGRWPALYIVILRDGIPERSL